MFTELSLTLQQRSLHTPNFCNSLIVKAVRLFVFNLIFIGAYLHS
jgi:hypothetical protein